MNATLGFSQLLERGSDLSLRDRDRLAKIMANGYHLLELINNVLKMSKIEAGRMELATAAFHQHARLPARRCAARDRTRRRRRPFRRRQLYG